MRLKPKRKETENEDEKASEHGQLGTEELRFESK